MGCFIDEIQKVKDASDRNWIHQNMPELLREMKEAGKTTKEVHFEGSTSTTIYEVRSDGTFGKKEIRKNKQ